MSMFRTGSNTPESFKSRDYTSSEALRDQVTFSKWLTKYNRLAGTTHTVTSCPKEVKRLYRTVHFNSLSKDMFRQKVHTS